jgi:hypothetical protein
MESKSEIDFLNLIHNQEFVCWVINPNQESDLYWEQIIGEHPDREKELNNAVFIIRSLLKEEKKLDQESVISLWERIQKDTISKKNTVSLYKWIAAASILLVMGIGGLILYQLKFSETSGIDYLSIAKVDSQDNEVKLIFADKSEEVLISKELEIKYNNKGEIEVNSEKRLIQKLDGQKEGEEQLNQLVVPRGRRSNLILSDGTKLWLNSGSRAIFPTVFTKKEREIYIEGEAYLEVAHDAAKPFFVVTDKIHVKVLGTKFNVSAYHEDPAASVVLVEGCVQATVDSKNLTMKPNQLLTYEKNSGVTSLQETNVLTYVSWKDGWMYCDKEPMESIAAKLSRYYNIKIEFKDPSAKELTLTGKLDLKTQCTDVFTAISSTAPIAFDMQDDKIVISIISNI